MSEETVDKLDLAVEYLDLDVFKPKFYKEVTIEGAKYGVLHPSDLTFDQWVQMLDVEKELVKIADDPVAAYKAGRAKVAMLIPDLPEDVLNSLNPKRLMVLISFVSTEIRKAAAEESEKLENERGNEGAEEEHEAAPEPSTSAN